MACDATGTPFLIAAWVTGTASAGDAVRARLLDAVWPCGDGKPGWALEEGEVVLLGVGGARPGFLLLSDRVSAARTQGGVEAFDLGGCAWSPGLAASEGELSALVDSAVGAGAAIWPEARSSVD